MHIVHPSTVNSCGPADFPVSRQVGLRNEALCQIVVTRFRPLVFKYGWCMVKASDIL